MIRLATSADGARVFRLVCCAKGTQCPYPTFERAYGALLGSARDVNLVAEDAEGRVWGFISLHAQNPEDADDPMAISQIVVSLQMHGMHAWLVARSYRLVHALRHYARTLAADGGLDGRELLTA